MGVGRHLTRWERGVGERRSHGDQACCLLPKIIRLICIKSQGIPLH